MRIGRLIKWRERWRNHSTTTIGIAAPNEHWPAEKLRRLSPREESRPSSGSANPRRGSRRRAAASAVSHSSKCRREIKSRWSVRPIASVAYSLVAARTPTRVHAASRWVPKPKATAQRFVANPPQGPAHQSRKSERQQRAANHNRCDGRYQPCGLRAASAPRSRNSSTRGAQGFVADCQNLPSGNDR